MFGYVNICKDELKIKEYNLFRAHYCGLCKAIGKRGSEIARLGLSYDMTFLALVLSAVDKEKVCIFQKRCAAHILHKHGEIHNSRAIDYAADMSVILAYLKLYDDWQDDRSIKALFGMAAYYTAVRKVKRRYKNIYDDILNLLRKLTALEKENCSDIDMTADCFANILKILFTPDFIEDENTRRTLEWLGYNTGRWIYIIDAYNDIEKDVKKKNYNPFVIKYNINEENCTEVKKDIAEKIQMSMDYTLASVASAYELLTVYRNDDILRNIIYIGLKSKQDYIMGKTKEEINESI